MLMEGYHNRCPAFPGGVLQGAAFSKAPGPKADRLSTKLVQEASNLLVPRPKALKLSGDFLELPTDLRTSSPDPRAGSVAKRLERELKRLGFAPRSVDGLGGAGAGAVRLELEEKRDESPEAYRLAVGAGGIQIQAGAPAGLFHGVSTLVQWLELHRPAPGDRPRRLPGVEVEDHPDFAVRGVLLDISRDKVPKLETLFELIDLLASLKYNQLQLYTEHTFAYRGHETVWRDASPLHAEEIRQLDEYCAERWIELVPNQQSFGHFHRWLAHRPYRHLAECPEGFAHPFSLEPEPFSLCATDPRAIELLADLYDQLLPHFRSSLLNVGCDETLDLGLGRSREICERKGRSRVYLDFLNQVSNLAAERGRRIQFWGDILLKRPDLLPALPENVIALEWGYEADHPFAEEGRHLSASGHDFYVCPGTSSWNSFAGRAENALSNLARAAVEGHANGASGYLVTDWGDFGHLQTLPVSYPGFMAGAAFSWNVASAARPSELLLEPLLDHHLFRDPEGAKGRAVLHLGNAYLQAGAPPQNGSALFFLLVFALLERERERTSSVAVDGLERALAHIEAVPRGRGLPRELSWTADMLSFACRFGKARWQSGDLHSFEAIPQALRGELRGELWTLIERHRENFLMRNRPGGLKASTAWLSRVANLL